MGRGVGETEGEGEAEGEGGRVRWGVNAVRWTSGLAASVVGPSSRAGRQAGGRAGGQQAGKQKRLWSSAGVGAGVRWRCCVLAGWLAGSVQCWMLDVERLESDRDRATGYGPARYGSRLKLECGLAGTAVYAVDDEDAVSDALAWSWRPVSYVLQVRQCQRPYRVVRVPGAEALQYCCGGWVGAEAQALAHAGSGPGSRVSERVRAEG